MKLETAVMSYYRDMYRKKRMPEGGFVSLNLLVQGDNPFSENTPDTWYIDNRKSTEESVIALYIIQQIFEQLSDAQSKILRMKMDGYTLREMTEILVMPMSKINREMKEINKVIDLFR